MKTVGSAAASAVKTAGDAAGSGAKKAADAVTGTLTKAKKAVTGKKLTGDEKKALAVAGGVVAAVAGGAHLWKNTPEADKEAARQRVRDAKASSTAWFKKQEDKVDAAGKKIKQRAADDSAKTKAAVKNAASKVEAKADALKTSIDKKAADAKAAKEAAAKAAEKTKADAAKAAEKAKAEAQKAADKVRKGDGKREKETGARVAFKKKNPALTHILSLSTPGRQGRQEGGQGRVRRG